LCGARLEFSIYQTRTFRARGRVFTHGLAHRRKRPHEQAVSIIRAQSGTHFDPAVVDAFVAAEREIAALSKTLTN
jgi:response regulator RpfG family c-di-GMP phosphodiesterase